MADAKISALASAAALTGPELIPMVQSGGNVAATPSQVRAFVTPSGGNKNYALTKASGSDYDFAYAGPFPLHPGYVAGGTRYYGTYPRVVVGSSGAAVVASTVYYTPLYVPTRTTFDRVLLRTGTANATGSNVLVGIYANSSGAPGAKLITVNALAAAVGAGANAQTTITPDAGVTPMTLDAGLYWVACVFDAASQMQGPQQDSLLSWLLGSTSSTSGFSGTSQVVGYTESSASLPATATPTASIATTLPGVFLRAA